MSAVLTLRDLSVGSRNGEILQGIDLDLMPGKVLGLIGESGAGKSTLGLAAIGYLKAGCSITGGSVTLLPRKPKPEGKLKPKSKRAA